MEMNLQKVARLLSHTHTFCTFLLVLVMTAGSLGVKAQIPGTISIGSFSAPTSGPAIAPINWTGYSIPANTINAFRVVVTVSNGACINRDATVASLNNLFPPGSFSVSTTTAKIDYPANSANITLPAPGVNGLPLFTVYFANTPGLSSTVTIENTSSTRPYFNPGFYFPTVGSSASVTFNGSATISGFIEKPGTPAVDCDNGINNSITNISFSFKVPAGQCVPISNFTTGTTGQYSKTVLKGFDYDVTPSKTNGNACGVTILDYQNTRDHILGLTPFTTLQQYIAADLNLSDAVTATDLSEFSKLLAGLFAPPMGYASWRFVPTLSYSSGQQSNWLALPKFIQVQNIQSNASNQDFIGVKMGDVNQSCSTCNQAFSAPSEERSEEFSVQLSVPGRSLKRGEKVVLPVSAENFTNISAFTTFISYDPTVLEIEKIAPGSLPLELGAMNFDREANVMRYAWGAEISRQGRTLQDGESILLIYAKVLQDIASPEQALWLVEEEERINELYDGNSSHGIFADEIKANYWNTDRKLSIQAFPNPFETTTMLSFYLPADGLSSLKIIDATGREISSSIEYRNAGQHYWQPENLPRYPGVLFCRLSMGDATQTIKLIQN